MLGKSVRFICALISLSIPVTAQTLQEKVARCKSADPDISIAGCTSIIQERLFTFFLPNERVSALFYNRGNAYIRKGNYDLAIQDYNEAIRLTPNDPDVYYVRGRAYLSKRDDVRAISDLTQAFRLNPKYALAYHYRGNAYFGKDDYEHAIEDYNEAIRLDPKDARAYIARGTAYFNKGDYDQAIQNDSEAIRIDPNLALAYQRRGDAYYAQVNLAAAATDFEHAISASPSSNTAVFAALLLHIIMMKQGRDDTQQLARVAAAADILHWPGLLLKLDMGQMTADEVMAAAINSDNELRPWRVCEANYFIGEDALFHHQRAEALARLKAAHDGCPKGDTSYTEALAELKRLRADSATGK